MREIEFRGLRKDGKGWVYGVPFHIYEEGKCFIIDNCMSGTLEQDSTEFTGFEVLPETVGQYIGLKDKKGVSIFEGDVIEHGHYKGFVVYVPQRASFYIKTIKSKAHKEGSIQRLTSFITGGRNFLNVTGNVHEGGEE